MAAVRGEGACGAAPVEDEGGHEDRLVCRDRHRPGPKRRQKWHGGFATRAEAETHRVALVAELEAGTYVEPSALTVDE